MIPEDWGCTRLGDLTTRVGSGITPTGGKRVYVTAGRPFLRSQNVGWGSLELNDLAFITEETHSLFPASEIKEGDVLLNITGASIGRSAVADVSVARGNVNQHVCEIRPDPDQIDSHFLNSYLLSAAGQRQIDSFQAGGNRQGLNYSQIRSFLIPQPSITEQRAIAQVLLDVDVLLEALEALIAKKRVLKHAAMQQLLTRQARLPRFDGEWEMKRLGDHASFLRNGVSSRAEFIPEGPVRCLHYGDVHACKDVYASPASLPCLPEDKATSLDRLQDGDLIFVDASEDVAGVGKSVEMREVGSTDAVSGLHTIAARFDKEVIADGFKGLLQFCPPFATHLRRLAAGTKVYATNRAHIADVQLHLPPVREQAAIATVLSNMDAEIRALEARRDKTRNLKNAMLQALITGNIRLVVPEEVGT